MNKEVILVDTEDRQVGTMEKMEAHLSGKLHRAFSVFIFNSKGELLLQQRAKDKYHSGGLWTNTCCSHPLPGENILDSASRRVTEEMGISAKLKPAFNFIYKTKFENGLTEHEFDHVFFGTSNEQPNINKLEVQDWKYCSMQVIANELESNPDYYTAWLKLCFDQAFNYFKKHQDELIK